ncbi:polysaccharide pyruvyl transferase family protein [uncultured Campylobacter sp.]|uniref:polysaccharide pyruvyl transferase family protein n=1 Tax=uncultured Campylobacter sp. TaxID=218934 RepID=UPI0026055FE9|nr:polysaccharide pyruvyl transferase family protein [uncultured Campylobacter sp.]
MKVAIFTLPLVNNYGGILQAYALQRALESYGFEAPVVNLKIRQRGLFSRDYLKFLLAKLIYFKKYKNAEFSTLRYYADTQRFVAQNIETTREIYSSAALKRLFEQEQFGACVLGSDQVFNPPYFDAFENDFSLGFAPHGCIKIAYAASFGGESFKGARDLELHKANLAKFKAISVRERNGTALCESVFGISGAAFVLDPTLLAGREVFEKFISPAANGVKLGVVEFAQSDAGRTEADGVQDAAKTDGAAQNLNGTAADIADTAFSAQDTGENAVCAANAAQKGQIFAYILDQNESKSEILKSVSEREGLGVREVNDKANRVSIEEWLSLIAGAQLVITDSFHGCAFSILFNKPFFAFINENRGSSRFYSLFESFELQDRVIKSASDVSLSKQVDWARVNEILSRRREASREFLISNLRA